MLEDVVGSGNKANAILADRPPLCAALAGS